MKKQKYIGCTIKQLPAKQQHKAAMHAIDCNPANRPPLDVMGVQKIAVLTTKYWGSGGVHLSVGFLSRASAALQEKILSHMNAWSKVCNVSFTLTSGNPVNADVRISLGSGGYWSYLGTDVGRIPKGQPTMNLEGFSPSTPESEYVRVVRHETGHTLGCPHEHMRAQIVSRLDVAKTQAYFQRTQGWTAQDVQQQVLTPINESSLMGTPNAEEDSIMCYALPATITRDGRPVPGGLDITAGDASFMAKLYPLSVAPPPIVGKRTFIIEVTGDNITGARIVS